MGISRDSIHKRRATGGRRRKHRKKRKYELGRPAAGTKIGEKRIHQVRARGGRIKQRAMRLEFGSFSWGSEAVSRKTKIHRVVYNASNNELVRTNTLVKGAIIEIDANPFASWYQAYYGTVLGKGEVKASKSKQSGHVQARARARTRSQIIDPGVNNQFKAGRLLACITSRPGQSGRADGYILEGAELEFYQRKMHKKHK